MRKIIRIIAICCLPLLLAGQGVPDEHRYCNARFDFCVEYPTTILEKYVLSDNGDGVTIFAKEGDLEVEIAGSYNAMDWGFGELHDMNLESLSLLYGEVEEKNFYQADRYFEFEVETASGRLFQRTYNFNGVLVTLEIRAPSDVSQVLFDKLKDEVQVIVNA